MTRLTRYSPDWPDTPARDLDELERERWTETEEARGGSWFNRGLRDPLAGIVVDLSERCRPRLGGSDDGWWVNCWTCGEEVNGLPSLAAAVAVAEAHGDPDTTLYEAVG